MEQSGIDMQRGLPGLPEGLAEPAQVVGLGAYLAAAVAVVLLAAAVITGGIWWARRLRTAGEPKGPGPRKEAEAVFKRLQRQADQLGTAEFVLQLSAALRRCVDRLWQTELSRQTWHEHWSENGSGLAALPEAESKQLAQLLADCNALKFEPLEIALQEKEELLRRARELVGRLPPRTAPAAPSQPPSSR